MTHPYRFNRNPNMNVCDDCGHFAADPIHDEYCPKVLPLTGHEAQVLRIAIRSILDVDAEDPYLEGTERPTLVDLLDRLDGWD